MPGINTTGKPQTSDILLGRGSIKLALLDSGGKPLGFRHIGNCKVFSLGLEKETLEHKSSRSGVATIDREIPLSQKINVTVTFDEILNFQNLATFLSGSATQSVTNRAATGTITDAVLAPVAATTTKGMTYELRDSTGARLYDINPGSLTVKGGATLGGASTLTGAANVEVDAAFGTVFIPATSSFTNGHGLWFSYTSAGTEKAVDMVDMMTVSKQSYFLRFEGINAASNDKKFLVDLHSVSLTADGDLALLGDEFAEATVTGVAERNETGFPTSPVGRIIIHGDS
jgi:hypothetical protein